MNNDNNTTTTMITAASEIKYLWKYLGFSCQDNSHQSKDIVNCVVNIFSFLVDGSSKVVDANIELNSTNLHFRSLIVFLISMSLVISRPQYRYLFVYANIIQKKQGNCKITVNRQILRKRRLTHFLQSFIKGNRKLFV